jgi:hypothetical protein
MLISFLIIMFLFLFLFQLYSYYFTYYEGYTNNCELQTLIDIATKQQQLETTCGGCNVTELENSLNELNSRVNILWQQSNSQQQSLSNQANAAPDYSSSSSASTN